MEKRTESGEEKISSVKDAQKSPLKKINLSGNDWLVIDDIPGMFYRGTQYFDFKKIPFINYNGLANLIAFLKYFAEKDIEVQFVNVNESIKNKIRSMGLDHILYCR